MGKAASLFRTGLLAALSSLDLSMLRLREIAEDSGQDLDIGGRVAPGLGSSILHEPVPSVGSLD